LIAIYEEFVWQRMSNDGMKSSCGDKFTKQGYQAQKDTYLNPLS